MQSKDPLVSKPNNAKIKPNKQFFMKNRQLFKKRYVLAMVLPLFFSFFVFGDVKAGNCQFFSIKKIGAIDAGSYSNTLLDVGGINSEADCQTFSNSDESIGYSIWKNGTPEELYSNTGNIMQGCYCEGKFNGDITGISKPIIVFQNENTNDCVANGKTETYFKKNYECSINAPAIYKVNYCAIYNGGKRETELKFASDVGIICPTPIPGKHKPGCYCEKTDGGTEINVYWGAMGSIKAIDGASCANLADSSKENYYRCSWYDTSGANTNFKINSDYKTLSAGTATTPEATGSASPGGYQSSNEATKNWIKENYKMPTGYDTRGGVIPKCAFSGTCENVNDLLQLGINIGKYVFSIIGSVAFLAFVYGGFTIVFSFGSAEKVKKGTEVLIAAVTGMAIAFGAYMLINFILDALNVTQDFRGIK